VKTGHAVRLAGPVYYRGLRLLRIPAVSRRLQTAGPILCYHNVVPPGYDGIGGEGVHMLRDTFERQMRWLAAHYEVVSLTEFVDRLERRASLRSTAVIAFDDGYNGVFELAAPILRALGISATVFVVAGAVGRSTGFWWDQPSIVNAATPAQRDAWLTDLRGDDDAIVGAAAPRGRASLPHSHRPADWNTIRAWIGKGIEIGVHSSTHRCLPTLSDAELDHEIEDSRSAVHQATGTWPEFFAYPYGYCDARVRARVRLAGYRAAVSLEPGLVGAGADPWCLRRINVPAGISDAAFEAWTAGLQVRRGA
jgi:peptidoglycan/xylan/chitin deacetylase (PgdA/CDA1 family)